MDLGFLLPKKIARSICPIENKHHWLSAGDVRSTAGEQVVVRLECKHCNKTEYLFLPHEQYKINEKQILGEKNA